MIQLVVPARMRLTFLHQLLLADALGLRRLQGFQRGLGLHQPPQS